MRESDHIEVAPKIPGFSHKAGSYNNYLYRVISQQSEKNTNEKL